MFAELSACLFFLLRSLGFHKAWTGGKPSEHGWTARGTERRAGFLRGSGYFSQSAAVIAFPQKGTALQSTNGLVSNKYMFVLLMVIGGFQGNATRVSLHKF